MGETRIGKRMFWSVLSLFAVFAVLFIVFQQAREKEYKIDTLNLRLQDYNVRLCDAVERMGGIDEDSLNAYVSHHRLPRLRVTIVDEQGIVLFDNDLPRSQYARLTNHRSRKEINEALSHGAGYDINRMSRSVEGDFFYSATYFKERHIVVRSALPYTADLAETLRADQHYIWFAVATVLLLSAVLYRFVRRLDANVTRLRLFARRADRNESLDTEDLVGFTDDELGEISEHIIKLYMRLQQTKEEQNILKRQLTQNIAHELKTPVASIQGYLETILANEGMAEATRRQFLDRCFAQCQRLASLLRDISTLNRMDDAPGLVHFEEVDIAKVVAQIERETALQLQERRMAFVAHLPASLTVQGNPSLLYSVFRNLTDNAIAYAGEGATITLSASQGEHDTLHFTFADNGVGVEPQHVARLFERFYRVDKGRSRKIGGTGLGLAIVKNAVLIHGGSIVAANNPGGGLRFDFTLIRNNITERENKK